jgi:hypothetical protein
MKKYLFGLGAMLVGAGLMFVLMHGEASADRKQKVPEPFVCSTESSVHYDKSSSSPISVVHCKSKKISCGLSLHTGHISCVD